MDNLSVTQLAWIAGLGWTGAITFCVAANVRDAIRRGREQFNKSKED